MLELERYTQSICAKNHTFNRRNLLIMSGAIALASISANHVLATTQKIKAILNSSLSADEKLSQLMPAIVAEMKADRCFVYMRDPVRKRTAFTHGYTPLKNWNSFNGGGWSREPNPETLNEPMLKKAFSNPEALFVKDIETAADAVLNKNMERSVFGHRALIHAPIYHKEQFYGILEIAMRKVPRDWSKSDRTLVEWLQPRVAKLSAEYLGHE